MTSGIRAILRFDWFRELWWASSQVSPEEQHHRAGGPGVCMWGWHQVVDFVGDPDVANHHEGSWVTVPGQTRACAQCEDSSEAYVIWRNFMITWVVNFAEGVTTHARGHAWDWVRENAKPRVFNGDHVGLSRRSPSYRPKGRSYYEVSRVNGAL